MEQNTMEFRNLEKRPLNFRELYRLFQTVNERYNGNMPTVTYCNITVQELTKKLVNYGKKFESDKAARYYYSQCELLASAIAGRLFEMGVYRT